MAGLQIYQNNPPADGQDGIEWFCEQEGGLWTHFASAYTAFCRVFGVASRFIDGFNSRNVVEENDGDDFFAVKYKNIYNWAEVYVPTNVDGSGVWVQMDVQYESFGEGGAPIAEGTFNIEVEVDSSINNTIYCNRDEYLKFKATLTSSDSSVDNRKILFVDTISQTLIGEATTDATGVATTYIQFDSSLMVGPHYIGALFQDAFNSTLTFLVDDVAIALYSVSPTDVDRAASNNFTIVTGNIYDPNHDTFDPIENATLNFVLLANGTETRVPGYPLSAFTPNSVVTDENGDFSIQIYVNNGSLVPNGYYQVRIDFNGTWAYDDGDLIFPLVNGSSNKQSLNVTGFIDKLVWFYIEGYENDDFNNPEVNRWDGLNLTATVINETTGLPIVGENVSFWDYTQGDLYIGNDFTDINGNASISYFGVTNSRMPGPNLLYALANPVVNYSYFIVNDSSQITIDVSGPNPMIINRTSPGILSFTINGNITGNIMGDRLRGALISLQMYKLGYDNTTYLDPNQGSVQVGADGSFSFNYEADDDTPQGNYTLLVRFNGRINHNWGPYPHDFNIPKLNKSMAAVNDLRILASDIFIFNFWINDTTSDNVENPIINSDEYYGLKVYLQGGADPLTGERVDFYDLTQNKSLGYAITDLSGYAKLDLQANWSMCAGPHLIRALYDGDNINDSYYIKNEQIYVNVNFGPNPNTVDKSGTSNRLFYIEGQVQDLWAIPVPYARLAIRMFGIGGVDETAYLLPQGPNQVDNYYYCNETGYFNASYYVHPSITAGFQKSELRVDFNGTFIYGQPYPYTFNLIGWSNFSDTDYAPNNNLTITDPDQISILMKANGSYLGSIFTDGNPPITVKEGDIVKLELNVTHSGIAPALFDQIIVRDVFANVNISTYTFPGGNGYVMLNISTAGNHSGLHKWELIFKDASFKVYDTTNSTYILINETVSMGASLGTPSITRSLDFWGISGIVSDGGQNLKAFEITLFLLDDSMQDVSYLLSIGGARTKVINPDGTYYYSGTISINAPHGLYYLVVNTTGGIQSTDAPLAISMVNAHTINSSSGNLAINVTAATDIKNEIYWSSADSPYPWLIDQWMAGYLLFVNGTLEYENGTAMVGVYVRVRVEHLNGTLISSGISTATDANGDFTITIDITSEFPDDRANSRIFIDFHPYNYGNNEGYVETDEQEVPI